MKVLIVYDSQYGNTEKIARAIGRGISGDAKILRPAEVKESDLTSAEILIVGSPTQGGHATQAVQDFLSALSTTTIGGKKAAAFDTRFASKLAKIFGFAASKMSRVLTGKGATLAVPPEGFFVTATKGPLKGGELERAAEWGRKLGPTQP